MKQATISIKELRVVQHKSPWEELLAEQIEEAGVAPPERQYYIYMPGASHPCRVDLAWIPQKLLVEVQGGQWVQGRHTRGGKAFETEMRKFAWYVVLGFRLLLITPAMIQDGTAIKRIRQCLEGRGGI